MCSSDGGKKKKSCVEIDRISNLPDSVICHILSFLDSKLSISTSLLSKRWISLWRDVPTLYFRHLPTPTIILPAEEQDQFMEKEANFEKFVTKSLLMNRCQFLDNFRLLCLENSDRLNILPVCVNTVITKNVHFLELNIVSSNGPLTLPTSLFTAKSLQSLILEGDLLVDTRSFDVLLPRIEYLSVKDVDYGSDESVRKLIEGCPILNSLCIERNRFDNVYVFNVTSKSLTRLEIRADGFSCYPEGYQRNFDDDDGGLLFLEINACHLKYFRLCDCVFEESNFQELPNLVELYLFDLDYNYKDPYLSMVGEILDKVGKELKILSIGGEEDLLRWFTFTTFTDVLPSLKKLIITTPSYSWSELIDFLIHVTYNLEVLELKAFCEMFDEIYVPKEVFPKCLWLSLRRISISFKIESKDEEDKIVRMMKYFLKHAKFLRQIEILDHNYNTSLFMKLAELNRTSRACKIN